MVLFYKNKSNILTVKNKYDYNIFKNEVSFFIEYHYNHLFHDMKLFSYPYLCVCVYLSMFMCLCLKKECRKFNQQENKEYGIGNIFRFVQSCLCVCVNLLHSTLIGM